MELLLLEISLAITIDNPTFCDTLPMAASMTYIEENPLRQLRYASMYLLG